MYSYLNKLLPDAFENFIPSNLNSHEYNTRNSQKFNTQYVRINLRKFSLDIVAPYVWNKIPVHQTNIKTYAEFKKKLKNYLIIQGIEDSVFDYI